MNIKQTYNNLNHPWYIYPSTICSPYNNYDIYRNESKRLFDFLQDYKVSKKSTLFHLIIGAAMEELDDRENIGQHWRQLLPIHVEHFLSEYKNRCANIIIVSPNNNFHNDMEYTPKFISFTDEIYKWKKTGKLEYMSQIYNIKINIFCTMFPHIDKRSKKIVSKLINALDKEYINIVNNFNQTIEDINFVKTFYTTLDKIFDKINENNGIITCFSFAVFNTKTRFSSICQYKMFSEIKKLFPKELFCCRILGEWVYDITNSCVKIYTDNSINSTKPIFVSYVENKKKNEFKIDYSLEYPEISFNVSM